MLSSSKFGAGILGVVLVFALTACGHPEQQAREDHSFPGPTALASNSAFTLLANSTDASGDALLVYGVNESFADLRAILIPELEEAGWRVTPPPTGGRVQLTENDDLRAERGGMCIHYWNMNDGAWAAAALRSEARLARPDFDSAASHFVTVLRVVLAACA